jgi:hypothetical protein
LPTACATIREMGSIFEILVLLAIAVFVVAGLLSTLGSGSAYEQIGKGGMSIGDSSLEDSEDQPDPEASAAEREQEIRQMLQARSERLQRQGKDPLDIEAELARVDSPDADQPDLPGGASTYDPGLLEETRQLIEARNQRRLRAGLEGLDVEAEVRRTLKDLGA